MINTRGSFEKILDLVQRDRNVDRLEASTKTYWSSGDCSMLVIISKQVLETVSLRKFFNFVFVKDLNLEVNQSHSWVHFSLEL